jgi:hypothetical protein
MASLTTSTDTDFTPAAGDFLIQVKGSVQLVRKNSATPAFQLVQSIINAAVVVSNPVAGAVYQLTSMQGSAAAALAAGVTVAVDQ